MISYPANGLPVNALVGAGRRTLLDAARILDYAA